MRVMTVLGTRPEIIRLSVLIERLDAACDHRLVWTGQNHDPSLADEVFRDLGVRAPDHRLEMPVGAPLGVRVGAVLAGVDALLVDRRPDRLVVLGDTDSALGAIMAKRRGVGVAHLEAGNRCFDDRVPEEVNRRIIDHASDLLLPYTARSREHLLAEGVPTRRITVMGNPILEVIERAAGAEAASDVLDRMGLTAGGYALATAHRQENVDDPARLAQIAAALEAVAGDLGMPVVLSVHPRTAARLAEAGLAIDGDRVIACPPFGFPDFLALERAARIVLTDSGTVQEEACLFGVPAVTIRDTTERPETVECGSNLVCGVEPEAVRAAVRTQLGRTPWSAPAEYLVRDASATALGAILAGTGAWRR